MWTGHHGFALRKLVFRDFTVRYRNMTLGIFWCLLSPIITVSILNFLFTKIMKPTVENFPVFALCGLVPFTFFTQTWGVSTSSIIESAGMIKKVLVPRELIPIASVLANSLNLLMQFGLLLFMVVVYGGRPSLLWLWLPVLGVLEIAFVCGLALLTSALNVYIRDTRYIVESINAVLFWLVPIFYSFSVIPDEYRSIYQLNPLAALTLALRNILLESHSPATTLLVKLTAVSFGTLAVGWLVFQRMKTRFYDYL
jgi:lipopolysaccharide transport system permease protein